MILQLNVEKEDGVSVGKNVNNASLLSISKMILQLNVEKEDGVSVGKNVNNASINTTAPESVHGGTASSPVAPDSSLTALLPIHPVNEEVKYSKRRVDFSNNHIST
eukprot:CAMPEP_0194393566 /NCGR_PEP_ID=MMETSP0174-20130528/123368_1 /TAXON_ID=216777 /ORGANISM="Proboscia alata, Strain PI-D3" /LENGTH=105 /DNA_ID=CAMNT_0039189263 /DNA_START=617 /DNA_END=934 /DNA_ORIENTATION=-